MERCSWQFQPCNREFLWWRAQNFHSCIRRQLVYSLRFYGYILDGGGCLYLFNSAGYVVFFSLPFQSKGIIHNDPLPWLWHALERKGWVCPGIPIVLSTLINEDEMPKIKTKSGAKKRFKITATGKVVASQSGKRHGMIKRSNKQIRNQRGTTVLQDCDARIVKQFLRNGTN